MCTLSLTTSGSGFILTSNRDEAPGRETLPPQVYLEDGLRILYPKDVQAGGTWLGVGENRRLVCLLNGEFKKHIRRSSYRVSRGIVVKDILKADHFSEAIAAYDLTEVEPFTMIIVDWSNGLVAAEVVWDGKQRHYKDLPEKPLLWSSSPLYTEAIKQEREQWFRQYFEKHQLTAENLLKFHSSAGKEDRENGVVMDRGFVKTRSISQVVGSEEKISFYYLDLESGLSRKQELSPGLEPLIEGERGA